MNRFVAVAVVVAAMPFVVGLAQASLRPAPTETKPARELSAVAEPASLGRKYGVAVVPMPELPSAQGREARADSRLPSVANGEPILACPDIRAIIDGSDPFAIVAYGEVSTVIHKGQSLATPAGPITVRRIGGQSIAFAQADTTLKCQLLVR